MNEEIKQILADKSFKENYSDSEIKEISVWIDGVVNQADKEEVAEQESQALKVCDYCSELKVCKSHSVKDDNGEVIDIVESCDKCLVLQNGEDGF